MCDMSPYFATNPAAGYGTGPGHDQYGPSVNGDPHATLASCAENGRYAQPSPATYPTHPHPHQLQYPHHPGHHSSPYSHHRSPYHHGSTGSPYDRISDMKPIADAVLNAHQTEPSPAASGFGWPPPPPPHSVQPPTAAPSSQPTTSPYDSGCKANSVSTSLTPPHESHPNSQQNQQPPQQQAPTVQQFVSCKMQSAHEVTGLGLNSPSHHHMYSSSGGNSGAPSPGQTDAMNNSSPLYPWMRSQFGKRCTFLSSMSIGSWAKSCTKSYQKFACSLCCWPAYPW